MGVEHDFFADFLESFDTPKERMAWRVEWDKRRAIAAQKGELLKHTLAEYHAMTERLKKMATAPKRGRPSKPKVNAQAEQLAIALDFVSVASDEFDDRPFAVYAKLADKMIIASTGLMSAGHPIVEELNLCPHLEKLRVAIAKCGLSLAITETPSGQLSIKGEKLRAIVPCLENDLAFTNPVMVPDPNSVPLTDVIKDAFKCCNTLASEAAERMTDASILLEAFTCTSTNGAAILQYFHGIDLPPHMVLPKVFTAAIAKETKKIEGFGYSWNSEAGKPSSITIWFEGGAWIKTLCYQDRWPEVGPILNVGNYPVEIPAGLFEAIEAVEKFTDKKRPDVYFADGLVMSHSNTNVGAQYEVPKLPGGKAFRGKLIKQVGPYATALDLTTFADRAFFLGGTALANGMPQVGTTRGALMCIANEESPSHTAGYVTEPFETSNGYVITPDTNEDDEENNSDPDIGWNEN